MAIQYSDTIDRYGLTLPTAYAVIRSYNGTLTTISWVIEIYTNAAAYIALDQSIDSDYMADVLLSSITLTSGLMPGLYAYTLTQPRYTGGSIV